MLPSYAAATTTTLSLSVSLALSLLRARSVTHSLSLALTSASTTATALSQVFGCISLIGYQKEVGDAHAFEALLLATKAAGEGTSESVRMRISNSVGDAAAMAAAASPEAAATDAKALAKGVSMLAVLGLTLETALSGLISVYMQSIFQMHVGVMWRRNVQLSALSVLFYLATSLYTNAIDGNSCTAATYYPDVNGEHPHHIGSPTQDSRRIVQPCLTFKLHPSLPSPPRSTHTAATHPTQTLPTSTPTPLLAALQASYSPPSPEWVGCSWR